MLCSIMTTVTSRGMPSSSFCTSRRSSTERPANGSSSSRPSGSAPAPWRSRRVGARRRRSAQRPLGDVNEADASQRRARASTQGARCARQIEQRVPTQWRQAEQRQHDVAQDGIAREQRDDLVGARHAEMRAPAAGAARDVATEQPDRAAVGADLARDQVEERGLAGAVRADDQPPLARLRRQGSTLRVTRRPPKALLRPSISSAVIAALLRLRPSPARWRARLADARPASPRATTAPSPAPDPPA